MNFFVIIINAIKRLFSRQESIGPKSILNALIEIIEDRKMVGFDDVAIAPHNFRVFLSEVDMQYFAPLMSTLKDQLRAKLDEYLEKHGYRVQVPVTVQIKEDKGLEINEIEVQADYNVARSSDFMTPPATPNGSSRSELGAPHLRRAESFGQVTEPAKTPAGTTVVQTAKERLTQVKDTTNFILRVVEGAAAGESISLRVGEHTFGRGQGAKFRLDDPEETLSRVHFKITVSQGEAIIKDLESKNGTLINDRPIVDATGTPLSHGDMINAGGIVLKVA